MAVILLSDAIDKYCKKGFGSMNKNDFEVYIFNELLGTVDCKGKSNYELSVILKIPESKVKRLRYEAALKYGENNKMEELVRKALREVTIDGEKIIFQTEGVMLKNYISWIMKKNGKTCDSSFNPEKIVIRIDDYEALIKEVYDENEIKSKLDEIRKSLEEKNKQVPYKITWSWILKTIADAGIKEIMNISLEKIIKLVCL